MDNEKLNEKLARWAGWTNVDFWHGAFWGTPPKQSQGEWLPDFTASLDACFKWLVPKLYGIHIWFPSILFDKPTYAVAIWATSQTRAPIEAYDKSLALALCKATEKLIGAENDR